MAEFDIKETGNELLKILEKELGSRNICRLSLDVQIPPFLKGDKKGFNDSIIAICKYLDNNLMSLVIDINLMKVGQYTGSVQLNVNIRGSNPDEGLVKSLITLRKEEINLLLTKLPYETIFFRSEIHAHFSFNITFEYFRDVKGLGNLFNNRKILLAEDNDVSALVFISFLEEWGCRVTKVSNGLLAVEEYKSTKYDIILMDIHMPEMPGDVAIRKIREFDQQIPIIALTTSSRKNDVSGAYKAGANNIIVKPVSSTELEKILMKYF